MSEVRLKKRRDQLRETVLLALIQSPHVSTVREMFTGCFLEEKQMWTEAMKKSSIALVAVADSLTEEMMRYE